MTQTFITDLDHTFLRNDLTISDFSKNIWNSYNQKANMGVATARSFTKAIQFLKDIDFNIPMILLDGALLVTKDKKVIDMKLIEKQIVYEIIKVSQSFDTMPMIIGLKDSELNESFLYPTKLNSFQTKLLERYKGDNHLKQMDKLKPLEDNFKLVYMGDKDELELIYQTLLDLFGTKLEYKFGPEAYLGCYYLTILNPDADKANGLITLSKEYNFDLENTTVFGDSVNDLGMFNLAKTSVAVSNSIDEVKNIATSILKESNDEDGVAKYLYKISREVKK